MPFDSPDTSRALAEQVQRLADAAQSPAPAWTVRLLADLARELGEARARAAMVEAELHRAEAHLRELAGVPGERRGYGGERDRPVGELLGRVEWRLDRLRRDRDLEAQGAAKAEARAEQAEARAAEAAEVAGRLRGWLEEIAELPSASEDLKAHVRALLAEAGRDEEGSADA
jgi:hypothetical protein